MGRYLSNLADVLRAAGLVVVELDGWQTRGRSNNSQYADGRPWCVMWHHTASTASGASDADYCTFRASDKPLCNLVIGGDGVVHVCAAGPTNTNGKGRSLQFSKGAVPSDSMNTYAVGIEISNNGVGQSYPQVQIDSCFAASIAICAAYGLAPADCAQHNDYAPDRKIDPATSTAVQGPWQPSSTNSSGSWSLDDLRAECRARASTAPTPPPGDDDDVRFIYAFREYANTFSDTGVHLSAEAYNTMVANGAVVIVSELEWPRNNHLDSLIRMSGLDSSYLVPK